MKNKLLLFSGVLMLAGGAALMSPKVEAATTDVRLSNEVYKLPTEFTPTNIINEFNNMKVFDKSEIDTDAVSGGEYYLYSGVGFGYNQSKLTTRPFQDSIMVKLNYDQIEPINMKLYFENTTPNLDETNLGMATAGKILYQLV